jgi:hypothetical protein
VPERSASEGDILSCQELEPVNSLLGVLRHTGRCRAPSWVARRRERGEDSARRRALDLKRIYDTAAPMVDEPLHGEAYQFINALRELVREAIRAGGGRLVYDPY